MTNARESFEKRLGRVQTWADRCGRAFDREMAALEDLYRKTLAELEDEKDRAATDYKAKEENIRASVESMGKDFPLEKYRMEKDKAAIGAEMDLLDGEQ